MASLNQFFTKPFHKLVLSLWPTSAMSVCTFLFNCFHNWTACCVISMFQTLVSKSLSQYIINWISCPEALFDVEASIRHRPTPYCVSFYNSWDPKSSPTQAHTHIYSNSITTLKVIVRLQTWTFVAMTYFVLGSSIISLCWLHWHCTGMCFCLTFFCEILKYSELL